MREDDYNDLHDSLTEVRTGISINRYTKVNKEGQLYKMELSGLGGKMTFQSSIHGFLDENTYQKDIAYLVAAIRLIFSLGGKRSSGLGWLQEPIECHVKKGQRGYSAETSEQELIKKEDIDQWIADWIGGKNV